MKTIALILLIANFAFPLALWLYLRNKLVEVTIFENGNWVYFGTFADMASANEALDAAKKNFFCPKFKLIKKKDYASNSKS